MGVMFHTHRQIVLSVEESFSSVGRVMSTGSIHHTVSRSHVNSLTWGLCYKTVIEVASGFQSHDAGSPVTRANHHGN